MKEKAPDTYDSVVECFRDLVETVAGKYGLSRCYVSDKWIAQDDFQLKMSEPFFEPRPQYLPKLEDVLSRKNVCIFSNADLKTTRKAVHDAEQALLDGQQGAGHGIPGVMAIALVGHFCHSRYIYVFTEKKTEYIDFRISMGEVWVYTVPGTDLLEGTKYAPDKNVPETAEKETPKAPVSPQIALKIRKIGLRSMKAKKELKSLADRCNLDEKQVLAIVHARTANEMLNALVWGKE
jgi:hypothetical protein